MKLSDFLTDVGRPVAFYPSLVKALGDRNEAIFICQMAYWRGKGESKDGWIYKSSDEIEQETSLTYKEQTNVRSGLKEKGILNENYARSEHNLYFKIDWDRVNEIWEHFTNGKVPPDPREGATLPEVSSLNSNTETTQENTHIGANAPGGLDWKFGHGQKVTTHDLELQREAEYRNSADLIAMGMGINSMVAYDIALSFMQIRRIVIPEGKVKGQRKAVREMIQSGVSGQHVKLAVEKLVGEGMTVVDLFSVAKTAEDIANQPAKIASERPEHQPVPPDPNEGKYVPSPLPKPKLVYQQAH